MEEDTRYKKHCAQDNDTSVPFRGGTLGPHTVLPITISCPIIFSWISWMVWNLFPFKGDFSFGKSQKSQGEQIWAVGGLSHLGDWMFGQNTLHESWCMSEHSCDEAANHQVPTAAAFWVIPIVSTEECPSLTQNLMQICCSTGSVILSVTATQYTRSLNSIYHPLWLVQWSCPCSRMCIPVRSPWLPGHIDVTQTILIY